MTKRPAGVAPAAERRGRRALWLLALVCVAIFVVSCTLGRYPIPPGELARILWSRLTGASTGPPGEAELVLLRIRLPRLLAGAVVGAGLAAAGTAYQGLFRNPLVSPDVLGASAGAGFGAALALTMGLGLASVSVCAFFFGLLAVGVAYLVSTRARRSPTLGMVLAGIMLGSLFTAGTSFLKLVADPDSVLPLITYWLMGSLSSIRSVELLYAGIPILGGTLVLFLLRWPLNLLAAGEDEARSMGLNAARVRLLVVAAATLVTAASVAISGMIGWVGLVVPHLARLTVGHDHRVSLPASMLMGAGFLMLVDNLARLLTTTELPIGILTAFVGAPFFLYLILDRGQEI